MRSHINCTLKRIDVDSIPNCRMPNSIPLITRNPDIGKILKKRVDILDYNTYGELYDQRPELVIHERLRHSGMAQELVSIASQQNFNVYFDRGPFRHDTLIKWHENEKRRPESHSMASALRYFKRLPG